MATLVKIANKDINFERLREEMDAAGLPAGFGALIAGFNSINNRLHQPFLTTQIISRASDPAGGPDITDSADPGELRFRFDPDLTAPQEATLDGLLTAHDATNLSTAQQNNDTDIAAIPPLVSNYNSWGSLTLAQKDNNHRQLTRLVARLLDGQQDL